MLTKLIVILGPTASGKSDLAVNIAEKFNGEVISADSRQVYKGLDIGTGKITKVEMRDIEHHLLDIVEPSDNFSVSKWLSSAKKAISEIQSRGKIPIICGGTGYYISALIDNVEFPEIENNFAEQNILEAKTSEELLEELHGLDHDRAHSMEHNGESSNKRRLARAIIIARKLGHIPDNSIKSPSPYEALIIGITIPDTELKERIHKRLVARIESGMIEEAKRLYSSGISYKRMHELGLEYRYLAEYLQGNLNLAEFTETLNTKIWQYARRQKTWWRKDTRIKWFSPKEFEKIESLTKEFI